MVLLDDLFSICFDLFILIFLLQVLFGFHALLGLLEEARLSGDLLTTTAEAMEFVEKSIFAVVEESLFFLFPVFLFPFLFLFLLSFSFLLCFFLGHLSTFLFLFLLFLFLVDLHLALQLSLRDGLAILFEGLVGTLEAILVVFGRWALFLKGDLLVFRLFMLIYNIVYIFLWCLLLKFLFLWLWLFAKDLSIVSLSILSLFLELLFNKLIHFSLVVLLGIVLGLVLLDLLLFLALRFFLLLFSGLSTVLFLLVFLHLFKDFRGLLLHLSHMLSYSHIIWVLVLAARRLLLG